MGYWSSAKYSWEKPFLFSRIHFFIHFSCRLFVIFILTNLICSAIVLVCFLILSHLFKCISQPSIGNCLFLVKVNSFLKTFHSICKLPQSEIRCSFIVIVYGMLRLKINCLIVAFNSFFVLFQFIISRP